MGLSCVHCSSTKAAWPLGTLRVSSSAWPLQVLSPLMSQHWPQAPGPWHCGSWAWPRGAALPAWRGSPVREEGCGELKNPHQRGRDPDLVSNHLVGVRLSGAAKPQCRSLGGRQRPASLSSGSWDPRREPHGAGPQDLSPAHGMAVLLPVAYVSPPLPASGPSSPLFSLYTITGHIG